MARKQGIRTVLEQGTRTKRFGNPASWTGVYLHRERFSWESGERSWCSIVQYYRGDASRNADDEIAVYDTAVSAATTALAAERTPARACARKSAADSRTTVAAATAALATQGKHACAHERTSLNMEQCARLMRT